MPLEYFPAFLFRLNGSPTDFYRALVLCGNAANDLVRSSRCARQQHAAICLKRTRLRKTLLFLLRGMKKKTMMNALKVHGVFSNLT